MSDEIPATPEHSPEEPPATSSQASEPAAAPESTVAPESTTAPEPAAAPDPQVIPNVAVESEPPARGNGVALAVTLAVVAAFIVGALSGLAGGFLGAKYAESNGDSGTRTVTVVSDKTTEPVVAASAAAVPSVVNIDVAQKSASAGEGGLPTAHPDVPVTGSGSGVAFKRAPNNGTYLLTNNHVVENAATITVRDTSGNKYPGVLVGRDADSDIAVVRIDAKLPIIKLGDSSKLVVGQTVVAIGSPFGLEHTVTSGVVSALGRSLPDFTSDTNGAYPLVDVIQTDAAINPGNSGGALVDRLGELIGINTAIYTESGASNGVGFAIPVAAATHVANTLIAGDKVGHPFLGIVGTTVNSDVQKERKLTVSQGALVEEITPGTGASKADLKPGDVVTALDTAPIRSMDDLILQVRRHAVGDKVTLTIVRDGKEKKVEMTVGDRPSSLPSSKESSTTTPSK